MFGDPPLGILVPPQRSESYDLLDHGPSDSSKISNPWPTPSRELRTSYRNLTRDGTSCSVILTWQTGSNCSTWLKAGLGKTAQPHLHQGPLYPRWTKRRRQRILNPAGYAILRTMRDQGSLAALFLPHSVLWLCTDGEHTTLDSLTTGRSQCLSKLLLDIFQQGHSNSQLDSGLRTRPLSQTTQPTRTHHPHRGEGS